VLPTIARRIGGTPGQVIFKWAHAKGFVVVTTTARRTRLDEYLSVVHLRASPCPISPYSQVVSVFLADLTPEEVEAIDEAGAKGPSAPMPSWLRTLSCARVASIRVVQGVVAVLFVITLLCFLKKFHVRPPQGAMALRRTN